MELCECLGSEEYQWRSAEVQRLPHHPQVRYSDCHKIKAAIQAAYEEGQSKLKGNGKSVPALSAIKTPLRDGDLERPDDEAYKNSYFINANSSTAPGIVDADRQPILERSEVYSGVYGRASITSTLSTATAIRASPASEQSAENP